MAFFSQNCISFYFFHYLFVLCSSTLYISITHTLFLLVNIPVSGEKKNVTGNFAGKWTSHGECEWAKRRASLAGDPWRTAPPPELGVPSSPGPPSRKPSTPTTSPTSSEARRGASSCTNSRGRIRSTRRFSGRRCSRLRHRRRAAGACRCSGFRRRTRRSTTTYSGRTTTGGRGSDRGRSRRLNRSRIRRRR